VSRAESGFRPPGMMLPLVDFLSPARYIFSPPTPSSYWMAWDVESVFAGSVGADNCMGDTVPLRVWHVLGRLAWADLGTVTASGRW
jgi:hypothetical protein